MKPHADAGHAASHALSHAYVPMAILALIWGCNWPVLKLGVTEIPPLTFRSLTLPFAALGMLAVARASGESIAIPRAWWGRVATLAFFNIAGWNGLVLFGVQQLPAGRSAILAYTMPVWATLVALMVLHEPLGRRKTIGLALGMAGMALLLGEDFALLERSPVGAMMILGAAILWSVNALGWIGVPVSSLLIDHLELFGLKQVWRGFRATALEPRGFVTPSLYRYVRHPMMSSLLIALWVTPHMTVGHLLLAVGMTIYVVVGVHYEERALVAALGVEYEAYRRSTPRFFPLRLPKPLDERAPGSSR